MQCNISTCFPSSSDDSVCAQGGREGVQCPPHGLPHSPRLQATGIEALPGSRLQSPDSFDVIHITIRLMIPPCILAMHVL